MVLPRNVHVGLMWEVVAALSWGGCGGMVVVVLIVVLTMVVFVVVVSRGYGIEDGGGGGMYVIGAICVALTSHGGFVLALFVLVLISPIVEAWSVWMMVIGKAMMGAATAKVRRVDGFMLSNSVVVVVVVSVDKVKLS